MILRKSTAKIRMKIVLCCSLLLLVLLDHASTWVAINYYRCYEKNPLMDSMFRHIGQLNSAILCVVFFIIFFYVTCQMPNVVCYPALIVVNLKVAYTVISNVKVICKVARSHQLPLRRARPQDGPSDG